MNDLRVLFKYHSLIRPYLAVFLFAIVFDVAMTLVGLLNPLFTKVLFDFAYPYRNFVLLNSTVIAIAAAYFLYFFLSVVADYLMIYVTMEATASLAARVYHAIQCLPLRLHQEKKTGDLLIRITDDVDRTAGIVTTALPTLVIEGGTFAVILAIALALNPVLTVLALFSIPLYLIETAFFTKRHQRVQEEAIDVGSRIYTHAQEKLSGIKTIKAFGQEKRETLTFRRLLSESYRIGIKGRLLETASTFASSITLQMWSLFIAWFLGYQVVRGYLTIGDIVALMLYLGMLGGPIQAFISLFTRWKMGMVSIRRLDEILKSPAEAEDKRGVREKPSSTGGDIKASNLSFAYVPSEKILNEMEVSFPPRKLTAIVGASGSGKTTLVNLLLRFFDPSDGVILLDGRSLSELKIRSVRERIGVVAQDYSLFDGTVLENLTYGSAGAKMEDVVEAVKFAGAYDFISRLPKGFDEQIGPGGGFLSGGQRQRIAIARTLLRNPEVIVFDEATSALDPESEFKIQEVMARLARTKTVIAIAHRLSTIKAADRILVLENGRFVEEGAFDELIAKKGSFYRFYWRQFGGLANLRQQLGLEFERAARYGSSFGLALLRIGAYSRAVSAEGEAAAVQLMQEAEYLIEKSIRMGDNCAILEEGYVFVLLPEIKESQLQGFFARMTKLFAIADDVSLGPRTSPEEFTFVATKISKKTFRTPEELMSALKLWMDLHKDETGMHLISPENLLNDIEGHDGK